MRPTIASSTLLFLVVALVVDVSRAWSQATTWLGSTGSWYDASNWSLLGGMPSSTVGARINNGGTALVTSAGAQAKDLVLGSTASQSGNVAVSGAGHLGMTTQTIVGDAGSGTLNLSNGGTLFSGSSGTILGNAMSGVGHATISNATWGPGYTLSVGLSGAGTLSLINGGKAYPNYTSIGNDATAVGTTTVDGTGSQLDCIVGISVATAGTATLTVKNGGFAGAPYIDVAQYGAGNGTALIQDAGSSFKTTLLSIGDLGTGVVTVSDGAIIRIDPYFDGSRRITLGLGGTLNVGAGAISGTVDAGSIENAGTLRFDHTDDVMLSADVSGGGNLLKYGSGSTTLSSVAGFNGPVTANGGALVLRGNVGSTSFTAANAATLRLEESHTNLGASGLVRSLAGGTVQYKAAVVDGGFLRGPGQHRIVADPSPSQFTGVTTYNSVDLVQDSPATLINFTNGGHLTNNAQLNFDGGYNTTSGAIVINVTVVATDFTSDGVISVSSGGNLQYSSGNFAAGGGSRTTVNAGGAIELVGGSEFDLNGGLLVNNGTISGAVNVNYGSLAKGTGLYGVVNVNTGGVFAPGTSPGVSTAETVAFDSAPITSGAPTLAIEIAGTAAGTQYDQLHVTGQLSLGGTLQVQLIGGFVPTAGQVFDILDWGTRSGTFSSIVLPVLSGLTWNTSQLYSTGTLSVNLPGDFNLDGAVNAADYVVWRKSINTNDTYNEWRSHFGMTASGGAGSFASAVPEPSAIVLLLLAFGKLGLRRSEW